MIRSLGGAYIVYIGLNHEGGYSRKGATHTKHHSCVPSTGIYYGLLDTDTFIACPSSGVKEFVKKLQFILGV